jgi:hypothetical protein
MLDARMPVAIVPWPLLALVPPRDWRGLPGLILASWVLALSFCS